MSSSWTQKPIGEIITLQRGHDLPSQTRGDGNIPIMGSAGLTGYHEEAKASGPGVIVGRSGNAMGEVHFISKDYWPLNTALYVTDFKGNDERFIYYLLKTVNFDQFNSGSAQKSLNRNAVYPFKVKITEDIEEQKYIAKVLADLEDKIELNRQINQSIEQMAQAIFKSWFVDFGPVRAKLEGRYTGLPAHIADLFPDELVESELGLVPKGWGVKKLKELSEKISKGTTPNKSELENAKDLPSIPFIKVKDISADGEINRSSLELIADSIHSGALKRSIIKTYDLLFSIAGTIGRVAIVDEDLDNSNVNQALAYIRLADKTKYFQICWQTLKSSQAQDEIASKVVQGVQANASLANVGDISVVIPDDKVLHAFNNVLSPITEKQRIISKEIRTLANIRDSLLPKLLSGEIDIFDTNNIAEAVA